MPGTGLLINLVPDQQRREGGERLQRLPIGGSDRPSGANHFERPRNCKARARLLATMRKLARTTDSAIEADQLIADLRDANRHRPRLQREFDSVGLP